MAENIESTDNESTDNGIEEPSEENTDDQKIQAEKRSILFVVYPILLVLVVLPLSPPLSFPTPSLV